MSDIEITNELMEVVALAQLYRRDAIIELMKALPQKKKMDEVKQLYKEILQHPKFKEVRNDAIKIEEATLIDDNVDTILLYYNELLREARFEKKYEVVTRVLKEIKQLKAIENDEMQFEVKFSIDDTRGGTNAEKSN